MCLIPKWAVDSKSIGKRSMGLGNLSVLDKTGLVDLN
jgi:hypothetical protein